MNKIKNFIVRHPYVSFFLLPILYYVSWIILLFSPFWFSIFNNIEFLIFIYIVIPFIWLIACIIFAKGKRLKIIVNLILILFFMFLMLIFIELSVDHGIFYAINNAGSKGKATTANHKEITNFMMVKFTQCSTGEYSLTYTSNDTGGTTTVLCSVNAQGHLDAIINFLKYENFKNPYIPSQRAAYKSDDNNPNEGRTHINCFGNTCDIYTNNGDEILSATVIKK